MDPSASVADSLLALHQSRQRYLDDDLAPGVDYWQPDWMVRELWGPGRMPRGMMVRLLRHTTFMQYGVPKEYEGRQAAGGAKPEAIARGHKIYAERCASCHGRDGLGHGEGAKALSPSPALLAYMIRRPIAVDDHQQGDQAERRRRDSLERHVERTTQTVD